MYIDVPSILFVVIGDIVIVDYEGERFPGKITAIQDAGAKVSTMMKNKQRGWR